TSNHTLHAVFKQEKIIYTITATASMGGTITPSGDVEVGSGESITFQINPSDGYYLDFVEVDGQNIGRINTYTFSNVLSNHTIYAKFEPNLNEWDIDGGGGDIADSGKNVDSGTMVTEVRENKDSGCGCTLIE
ncbi:MAG: hypothetical protein N3B13_06965, partial [Deltaproteobacteria bacterium]|nr:hypothetical protein [Deltaproteobacteria bacterium]